MATRSRAAAAVGRRAPVISAAPGIRVVATAPGFAGGERIEPGQVFEIASVTAFSARWMRYLDGEPSAAPAVPATPAIPPVVRVRRGPASRGDRGVATDARGFRAG